MKSDVWSEALNCDQKATQLRPSFIMEYSLILGITTKHTVEWKVRPPWRSSVDPWKQDFVAPSVLDIAIYGQHGSLAVPNTTHMAEKDKFVCKLYFRPDGFCVKKDSDFSKPLS